MKATRKMMILIMKEYMSSLGELKFSAFIKTSAADASSPTTAAPVRIIEITFFAFIYVQSPFTAVFTVHFILYILLLYRHSIKRI